MAETSASGDDSQDLAPRCMQVNFVEGREALSVPRVLEPMMPSAKPVTGMKRKRILIPQLPELTITSVTEPDDEDDPTDGTKGERWTDQETSALLTGWERSVGSPIQNDTGYKRRINYRQVQEYVISLGFNRTVRQCQRKCQLLRDQYRRHRKSNGEEVEWQFYERLRNLIDLEDSGAAMSDDSDPGSNKDSVRQPETWTPMLNVSKIPTMPGAPIAARQGQIPDLPMNLSEYRTPLSGGPVEAKRRRIRRRRIVLQPLTAPVETPKMTSTLSVRVVPGADGQSPQVVCSSASSKGLPGRRTIDHYSSPEPETEEKLAAPVNLTMKQPAAAQTQSVINSPKLQTEKGLLSGKKRTADPMKIAPDNGARSVHSIAPLSDAGAQHLLGTKPSQSVGGTNVANSPAWPKEPSHSKPATDSGGVQPQFLPVPPPPLPPEGASITEYLSSIAWSQREMAASQRHMALTLRNVCDQITKLTDSFQVFTHNGFALTMLSSQLAAGKPLNVPPHGLNVNGKSEDIAPHTSHK